MSKIDGLTIQNFRGSANSLEMTFSPNKRLAVIFGENGTGKTTIVDAIDVVANQNVGSIKDRGSTNTSKHSHTIGKSQADISITMKSGAQTWTATMTSGRFTATPESPPRVRILRKANLQRFIDAKPAERYAELRYLIAVDRVEKSEQTLNEAVREANAEANRFAEAKANAEYTLEQVWNEEGRPSSSALEWAQAETLKDRPNLDDEINQLTKLIESMQLVISARNSYERATQDLGLAMAAAESVNEEFAVLGESDSQRTVGIVKVLQDVETLLGHDESSQECPICRYPIDSASLMASVKARLADLAAMRALSEKRATIQVQLVTAGVNQRRHAHALIDQARIVLLVAANVKDSLPLLTEGDVLSTSIESDIHVLAGHAINVASLSEQLVSTLSARRTFAIQVSGRLTSLRHSLRSIDEASTGARGASTRKAHLEGPWRLCATNVRRSASSFLTTWPWSAIGSTKSFIRMKDSPFPAYRLILSCVLPSIKPCSLRAMTEFHLRRILARPISTRLGSVSGWP